MSDKLQVRNEMEDLGILREQILFTMSQTDIQIRHITRLCEEIIKILNDNIAEDMSDEDTGG